VEKAGTRRRRMYKITREGLKVLLAQQDRWKAFVLAINRVTGGDHA